MRKSGVANHLHHSLRPCGDTDLIEWVDTVTVTP